MGRHAELTTRWKVVDAVRAFRAAYGRTPQFVHFTPKDEENLAIEALTDAGQECLGERVSSRIQELGPRGALPTFLGYDTVWDAPAFKVTA